MQGLAERMHPRGKQGALGVEVGMWRPLQGYHVWPGAGGRGLENSLIFSIFAGIAFPPPSGSPLLIRTPPTEGCPVYTSHRPCHF